MASYGWQGQKYLYTPMSGYDYYVDLWIDSITHSGTTLRITGEVSLDNVGSSSSWYNWYQPVYANVQDSSGNNLQTNIVIREANTSMPGGTHSSGSFDVTISGVAAATTSYTLRVYTHEVNNRLNDNFSWNLSFDASGTPPSNGSISGLNSVYENGELAITASSVSVSSNSALTGFNFRVLESAYSSDSTPCRYIASTNGQPVRLTQANSTAGSGGITLLPNKEYHTGLRAQNAFGTYRYNGPTLVTVCAPATISVSSNNNTARVDYSTPADGGNYTKTIEYSLDNGATWKVGATVSSGSASSGTFTIYGLSIGTTYTLKTRVTTVAGSTYGPDTVFTAGMAKLYGSVNGNSEEIIKLYGSVGGESKAIKKLYGSVNGRAKLIYKEK